MPFQNIASICGNFNRENLGANIYEEMRGTVNKKAMKAIKVYNNLVWKYKKWIRVRILNVRGKEMRKS